MKPFTHVLISYYILSGVMNKNLFRSYYSDTSDFSINYSQLFRNILTMTNMI